MAYIEAEVKQLWMIESTKDLIEIFMKINVIDKAMLFGHLEGD